jgi:high-affinity nickel-transport protein
MLFTAGMTLVDSIDSILMLYSYTGFPEQRFRLFEPAQDNDAQGQDYSAYREAAISGPAGSSEEEKKEPVAVAEVDADTRIRDIRKKAQREMVVKRNMMSGLSIVLTLMSIIVAFRCEFYPTSYLLRARRVRLFFA